jgi:2-pyrone-4,6-dicarboxylate lactonase
MSSDYQPFHPDPRQPEFRPPSGACDSHCHVFGPKAVFPFAPESTYQPVDAGKELLFDRHRHLGLERGVIVQASCHGTDNRAMVDALRAEPARYRGIAMVGPAVEEAELEALQDAGVRGIRFNFVKHLGGAAGDEVILATIHKVVPYDWHTVVHLDADAILDLVPLLERIPTVVIIDHMGRIDASKGPEQAPFQALCGLLARDDRFWVKVSGAERISGAGPPFLDAVPFARHLVERFSERVLWGTDWPHPNIRGEMPDDGDLVDLIPLIAPSAALRQALLVDKPARLYWG